MNSQIIVQLILKFKNFAVFHNYMNTLKGKVITGLGTGKKFLGIKEYFSQFETILGASPFPGTLNLKVDPNERKSFLSALESDKTNPFEKVGRKYYSVEYFKISIKSIPCLLIIPEKTHHDESIIEIISEKNLRNTLNLKDNSSIEIKYR
tara:strand:+ start:4373 stop:4822 length:450 start_codon:yes stop_codon:yes gene_type:complete